MTIINGYVIIHKPDHPFCDYKGNVKEHRLIMENKIGRYLNKDEDVHHINGDRADNRIENLELMSHSEHMSITNKKDMSGRICVECGSSKTAREGKYLHWRNNPITKTGLVCNTCYRRLRWRLKQWY